MMQKKQPLPGLVSVFLLLALLTGPVLAEDPADEKETIIIQADDGSVTVDKTGEILRIVHMEDGEEQVMEFNLDQMGLVVDEALADVGDLLSGLEDLQMTFRLGEDNRLSFTQEDSYWELDLDEIMSQVGVVLEGFEEEFDLGEWTHNSRHHHFEMSDDDLKDELEALRQEVRELKRELETVREK